MAIIKGSPDDYDLYGTKGDDKIYGAAPYGQIDGGPEGGNGEGNDTIYGSMGRDSIFGGVGDDRIYGRAGDDFIYMDEGNDRFYGGAGNDLFFNYSYDTIDGRSPIDGHDFIDGGTGGGGRYGERDMVELFLSQHDGRITCVATDQGRYTIVSADGASDITMRNIEQVSFSFGDERDFIDLRAVDDAPIEYFQVSTEGGDDRVLGSKYAEFVYTGADDETVRLNGGQDTFYNSSGHDTAYLGGGRDRVVVSNSWSTYKTEILDFKNGEDTLFFRFSEEGERTFDTNGDGFFGRDDAHVLIKGGDMVIDVGGLDTGSDGGGQTLILDDITKVGLGSVDFDILGGIG